MAKNELLKNLKPIFKNEEEKQRLIESAKRANAMTDRRKIERNRQMIAGQNRRNAKE